MLIQASDESNYQNARFALARLETNRAGRRLAELLVNSPTRRDGRAMEDAIQE
jgi:hypothetical protein